MTFPVPGPAYTASFRCRDGGVADTAALSEVSADAFRAATPWQTARPRAEQKHHPG